MKHTFKLIDNLIILLKDIPRSIDTEVGKIHARNILVKILVYTHSLRKLVESHKTSEYLNRLHELHIAEIEGWVNSVTELFQKFDELLRNVEADAKIMENVIENQPEKWLSTVSNMAFGMVVTGLHEEEEKMERFRRIAIFEEHELRSILDAEEHIAELLK
ncbi:MAG: hypothetical protein ABIC91_03395 [Nanoarchaeota archaeon]|nr:hypothetical protein [Nanoarchaeota archaeon]MBU1030030.1 hypothetical protein [Nanoarchaeota archaeon]